jgi:hypothetical protein
VDEPGFLVEGGGLNRRNVMPAQALAHDIKPRRVPVAHRFKDLFAIENTLMQASFSMRNEMAYGALNTFLRKCAERT